MALEEMLNDKSETKSGNTVEERYESLIRVCNDRGDFRTIADIKKSVSKLDDFVMSVVDWNKDSIDLKNEFKSICDSESREAYVYHKEKAKTKLDNAYADAMAAAQKLNTWAKLYGVDPMFQGTDCHDKSQLEEFCKEYFDTFYKNGLEKEKEILNEFVRAGRNDECK